MEEKGKEEAEEDGGEGEEESLWTADVTEIQRAGLGVWQTQAGGPRIEDCAR